MIAWDGMKIALASPVNGDSDYLTPLRESPLSLDIYIGSLGGGAVVAWVNNK